jgi:Bacterial HORMA domain 2
VSNAVHVNTTAYAVTHVATNMLGSIRSIVKGSGLDPGRMRDNWAVLENGIATWLETGDLRAVTLEVYDPGKRGDVLVGRFDFTLDYGYYPGGDGDLWLDPDTVAYAIAKNGSFPGRCEYRVVADAAPGRPDVAGWATTSYRSTAGFTRHTIGTAIGGGSIGAGLAYYTRSSK